MDEIQELLSKLLWGQLRSVGLFADNVTTLKDIKTKACILDLYDRWLEQSIAVLEQNNYIRRDGQNCLILDTAWVNIDALWEEWNRKKELWLKNPNLKAYTVLLEATMRNLPGILTGKVLATDIMFPDSSMKLVEGIYKNNPTADYFNEVLAGTVTAYIDERINKDRRARIRIFEVGAGTGGTSAVVLKKLQAYREHVDEYCYSDISKAFLLYAEREYGPGNPYLTYKIFNTEASPSIQGIEDGGYDIVIATNVLHATRNIRETLRNIKPLLKKNGLILLNEITGFTLFSHLTFGLLEGWWMYEDKALRAPGCPGLYPETWQKVLEIEGFRSVFFPAKTEYDLGQQVIVAESDGVVRKKQKPETKVSVVNKIENNQTHEKKVFIKEREKTADRNIRPVSNVVEYQTEITENMILEKSKAYMKKLVGEALKISPDKISSEEPLEKYGIDSILVVQLTSELRKVLDNISSTLFFEYQTIDALVEHFINTQKDKFVKLIGLDAESLEKRKSDLTTASAMPSAESRDLTVPKSRRMLSSPVRNSREAGGLTDRVKDIAIIGLAGRYAKADNIFEFWDNLKEGVNCIEEIPSDRWDWKKFYNSEKGKKGSMYTKWGGFIKGADKFDSLFFRISPAEAESMDPQERLFLEVAYQSMEDAGYTPQNICSSRKVGVFVGVMNSNYPTGTTYWSIANRISYVLNFLGPSMAVDSACSSSLTAIHLALESLYSGTSECAIAGGVNLITHPVHYIKLSGMTMLSPSDTCKAFGDKADGFVDGEGVGAIVLKPLEKAVADGDHIYGIIKGSSVNAGGKTNGYTVPNPNAQSQLIEDALKRSGINPRTISYIEAHGTGTALGDPIEIAGLNKAFGTFTNDRQFCAIGSVKTNIGHCESASGIAGLTKVLLQMKHCQLVPSLNSKDLNPDIDFASTPFMVQQELREWKRPKVNMNGTEKEFPRTAGISSFGAGGANAHIIVQEYIPQTDGYSDKTSDTNKYAIVVLSAKNEDRLTARARQLLDAIKIQKLENSSLMDLAYTLQVGREPMEERLALMVNSIEELSNKLEAFLKGNEEIEGLYRGQVKRNKEALSVFSGDEDLTSIVDAWISKGKYSKLLDVWVKGLDFDWSRLYGEDKPGRISLPVYPFNGERYWIQESKSDLSGNAAAGGLNVSAQIHPLLHQNTSDFLEQRYSSVFTGNEFFLSDHRVKGQSILPGAVYLEMAGAAVRKAAGLSEDGQNGIRLKNVVWLRPAPVGSSPLQVHIGLNPEENGDISFKIYGGIEEEDLEPAIYSQGSAVIFKIPEAQFLDIDLIKSQCDRESVSSSQCYEAFREIGIDYGKGHRGIENIYAGQDCVLAKLGLPFSISDTLDKYVLHPGLMDSALQASIGLGFNKGDTQNKAVLSLPFALEELDILDRCTEVMWAYIRICKDTNEGNTIQKLDIDVCNQQGKVCVKMRGYSSRRFEDGINPEGSKPDTGTLMMEPIWVEKTAALEVADTDFKEHLIFLYEDDSVLQKFIENHIRGARCFTARYKEKDMDRRFEECCIQLFKEIRGLMERTCQGKVLLQVLINSQNENRLLEGLSGLINTAMLESTKLVCQLIRLEPGEKPETIVEILKRNSGDYKESQIMYRSGKRYVRGLSELKYSSGEMDIPWKDGGVYLITGGIGGLGLIFAFEIAKTVKRANIILTGRSPFGKEIGDKIKDLKVLGAEVVYRQADVSDRKDVNSLIQGICEDFGRLDGILHSAGVICDNYIMKKTEDEFKKVLAPKVSGVVNLDMASKDMEIDFFILFSSNAGCFGNPGQADYSSANAFMDAYAAYRSGLSAAGLRRGLTLSVNWPLWKDGGMQVDAENEKRMLQSTGMVAMKTEAGIQALYKALASGKEQVIVVEGILPKLKQRLLSGVQSESTSTQVVDKGLRPTSVPDKDNLQEIVQTALIRSISELLKVKIDDIDENAELNEYGFDSITYTELSNKLNKEYKLDLAPTVFYEYTSIYKMAKYLATEFSARFRTESSEKAPVQTGQNMKKVEFEKAEMPQIKLRRMFSRTLGLPGHECRIYKDEPVAIIGVSGIFPMANDLDEFWKNLEEGRDCISEIPEDRWDWREFYGDPRKEVNKTNVKWGGFIEGIDEFDPVFFGISPREAEIMDPQQRLLMTYVWKVIEDAGYSAQSLSGTKTGIFAGTGSGGYGELVAMSGMPIEAYTSTSLVSSVGPNRMSYFLNIHGPSEPIETACSSSLVAIHRAVTAIAMGNCDMAIAGGINTIVSPSSYISFSKSGMLCEDGRCKAFSDKANGYVRGEGVGMLFLKRLEAAEQDGDHIYGVIRGTSENHGGRASSLTAPNPKAQADVLVDAYRRAGIDPRTVTYIEAHGTGTELGDPIEINGLKMAFNRLYQSTGNTDITSGYCGLGSVKSNIGHLELAAGVAGVIKVLLQMKHKKLAKSLHCHTINPYIQLEDSPFYIVRETMDWKALKDEQGRDIPRRAGVSSFGFGGVNAHVVIEEYIQKRLSKNQIAVSADSPVIVVLSAKTEEKLKEKAEMLLEAVNKQRITDEDLSDLSYTLQVGRDAMEERLAFTAGSIKELYEKLDRFINGHDDMKDLYRGHVKRKKGILPVSETDEETAKEVETILNERNNTKLMELWVNGLDFDWNRMYGNIKPRRISLPTYPFARDKYWVSVEERVKEPEDTPVSIGDEVDEGFYDELFENVINDNITIDAAVNNIKNMDSVKMGAPNIRRREI
jgi:acyl transferase domain-containing protein/acyl carrier protein/SAM-dependent methyltransferase